LRIFCNNCCSDYIEGWEKLLHYSCIKSCAMVNISYALELYGKMPKGKNEIWIPKPKEKIDYMLDKEKNQIIKAEVIDTIIDALDPSIINVKIKYTLAND